MRLQKTIEEACATRRAAMIGYLPVGFPSVAGSLEAMVALVEAGFDVVELGMPYSDPLMDGPVIQSAAQHALAQGTTTTDTFTAARTVRDAGATPVVMSYWNLIDRFGLNEYAAALSAAGGAGVITPDLNVDEAGPWVAASSTHELDRVFLIAPSCTPERLQRTLAASSGFVYAASTMGVTGARNAIGHAAEELVQRARPHTSLPLCVGLGVSTAAQVREISEYADGVIIGSALVAVLGEKGPRGLYDFATELVQGVR